MDESNGRAPEPMPEFDLGHIGRGWRMQWMVNQTRVTKLQLAMFNLEQPAPDDAEAARSFGQESVRMLEELYGLAVEQSAMIAQVLISVPREWLTSDAPEGLDWSEPASLDYVLEFRFGELVGALNSERAANSKNSPDSTSSPPPARKRSPGKATT